MARKVLQDAYYTFANTAQQIIFNQGIPREKFVLITNVSTNQVLYNFSDPLLGMTAHSISTNGVSGQVSTTVTLAYNTGAMPNTSKIQVVIDEYEEKFTPSEVNLDPVNKFRTSTPQALIDTDFEYGSQSTKWETVGLVNNKPTAYANTGANNSNTNAGWGPMIISDIIAVANSPTINVVTLTPPPVNSVVVITDTNWAPAEGTFIVESVATGAISRFTYTAKQRYSSNTNAANVSIFVPNVTQIANGNFYNNNKIAIANAVNFTGGALGQGNNYITTFQPHGFTIGNQIIIQGVGSSNAVAVVNGTFLVTQVISNTVFRIDSNVAHGSSTGLAVFPNQSYVYPATRATVLHRAYDGGVEFSTSAESHNNQIIRQTRRYFRYQSGKGIQVSTGTLLKPSFRVDGLTSSGTLVTVKTKEPHFVSPNVAITLSGEVGTGYNGNFLVNQVVDPYTFTYIANSVPTNAVALGNYRLSANTWYGAASRMGLFDDQNGMFFEFDGQVFSAVRRNSVYQIAGYSSANNNNTTISGVVVNGITTSYSKQLTVGDNIVIKGMTYRVEHIRNDQTMDVQPAYRGEANTLQTVVSKTIDFKVPQSQWNIDRCDGTGPSGFNLDLTKMQMFYIDYSWYGAGFVRWGVRGPDGNVIYIHKMINNNVNYEAHMRSGNLPARYETNTFSKKTKLGSTLGATDATMNVSDASAFPTTGTVWVNGGGLSEYINYNGISNNFPTGYTLNNLVRGQFGNTINVTMTTSNSTLNLVTGSSTINIQPGMYVQSANIPQAAVITKINPNVSIEISQSPTIAGVGPVTFIPMGNLAQTFPVTTTNAIAVDLHAPGYSPRISHWGTSVIMDGRYDDDKSLVFTQGMTVQANVNPGQALALQSFRIAPSVSNGTSGATLGVREITNRMQMVLRTLDMLSGGTFLVKIVLNSALSNNTPIWSSVGGSSLAQYINHTVTPVPQVANGTFAFGGETLFSGFTNASGGGSNFTTTTLDLPLVRDIGNSIIGGGQLSPQIGFFPDGPDMVTIVAQNIGVSAANIFTRLSWTEAQA
jgi:hypothetical protein